MTFNIAKLQAQLQHVPDQALIGYVQNPDGQVPSYLALAELSRRKEIRANAAPQQQAPTQTVAEQEISQVEPGVAGLPIPDDMYQEKSMAAGGIVAFEGGGDVTPGPYNYDYNYESYYKQPSAALMSVPKKLDLPGYEAQLSDAYEYFGVNPKYFDVEQKSIEDKRSKDLAEAKRMGQADMLFSMAEKLGSTPGGLLRGLSATTGGIRQSLSEMNKTTRAIETSADDALRSNRQAKQAFAMGDARGAMSAIDKRDESIRSAESKNAELETTMRVALAKEAGESARAKAKLKHDIYNTATDNATNMMRNKFPQGSADVRLAANVADRDKAYMDMYNSILRENIIKLATEAGVDYESMLKGIGGEPPKPTPAPTVTPKTTTKSTTTKTATPVKITSKAEYDKLDSGTSYIAPDGTMRTKP